MGEVSGDPQGGGDIRGSRLGFHPPRKRGNFSPHSPGEEFIIGGYLASGPNHLSTLIVGQHDREGRLVYSGMVGTGLSDETRLVILRELQAIQRKSCPFSSVPELREHFGELRTDLPPHWVRPTLVVEVEYRQRLKDGLRHAAIKGLRPDKKPGLIRRSPQLDHGPF